MKFLSLSAIAIVVLTACNSKTPTPVAQEVEGTIEMSTFASVQPVVNDGLNKVYYSAKDSTQVDSDALPADGGYYTETKANLANVIVIMPHCLDDANGPECVKVVQYDSTGVGSDAIIVNLVNGKLPSIKFK